MKKMLCILLPMILLSCTARKNAVIKLVSDNPEVLMLVEYTHTQKKNLRIVPHYKKHLVPEDLKDYDLVVSADISALPMRENLLFSLKTELNRKNLYSWSSKGIEKERKMVPLSFDLPVIIYRDEQFAPEDPPFMIHRTDLEEWASLDSDQAPLTRIGFSPLWNISYIRFLLESSGEDFTEQGFFDYDPELLAQVLQSQKSWIEDTFGGELDSFNSKYRYMPDLELLKNSRVDFIESSLTDFLTSQETDRKGVQFSFLAEGHHLRPQRVIYAGIGKESKAGEFAASVLNLWTDPHFQKGYLHWKKQLREESFGFLGGFSTIEEINHFDLSRYYPELESHFVQDMQFLPPHDIPLHWSAIEEEVLNPWLADTMGVQEYPGLDEFYREWELHYIPD